MADQNIPLLLLAKSVNEESEDEEGREGYGGENPRKGNGEGEKKGELEEDGSGKSSPSSPSARKPDPYYLVYAFSGCLFFATSGILRKY